MTSRAIETDVLVVGGGPAGLAAAAEAAEAGADVTLIDRNSQLGGILDQCIHDGFGLHAFGELLTGPEFAARYVERALDSGVAVHRNTMVVDLTHDRQAVCTTLGKRFPIHANAVILAMGCRERTRGMIRIPGTRPAGVYTAGTAQWLTNMANIRVGKRIVILGSGDIGLIMARRLTWEGATVVGVLELLPYPSGLPRNIQQCLMDYDIPLYLSHSVTCIHGRNRLERVTVSQFDSHVNPVPGTEFDLDCDTLLLSVGLIPETELARRASVVLDQTTSGARVDAEYMTNVPGLFSCGNVLHIHDLADWAAEEGERAGQSAAQYALAPTDSTGSRQQSTSVVPGSGIRYVVPQTMDRSQSSTLLSLRVKQPADDVTLSVSSGNRVLASKSLRHAHPAAMLQIAVDGRKVGECDQVEVTVQ